MKTAAASPLHAGLEQLVIEGSESLITSYALPYFLQVLFLHEHGGTLAVDGEAELVVGPVLARFPGILASTSGFAADIPLGADTSGQDWVKVGQCLLDLSNAGKGIGHNIVSDSFIIAIGNIV